MSEITMKTIESLPLVEEPAEDASIVGWNNGKTVRMPVGAIGGGTKGIVFTYSGNNSSSAPMSLEPLAAVDNGNGLTCNYNFDECYELLQAGAPAMFVDTNEGLVTSVMMGSFGIGGGAESIAPFAAAAPEGAYIYLQFSNYYGDFYIEYTADYLNGYYGDGDR